MKPQIDLAKHVPRVFENVYILRYVLNTFLVCLPLIAPNLALWGLDTVHELTEPFLKLLF